MPRLFEQTEDNSPLESLKIAFGKAATSTYNMTFANLFAYLRSKLVPSETVTGLIEIATQAEALAGTDDARAITPLKLAQKLATLATSVVKVEVVPFSWNMDALDGINVPWALPASHSILGIEVQVNLGSSWYPLNYIDVQGGSYDSILVAGGFYYSNGTQFVLERNSLGVFNDPLFNAANGLVFVEYIANSDIPT